MAFRIKDTIQTDKGSTNELYGYNFEYYRDKLGNCRIPVKYCKDDTKEVPVKILENEHLKNIYEFTLSDEEIGSDSFEKIAYNKIQSILKSGNYSVESDATGEWVAV